LRIAAESSACTFAAASEVQVKPKLEGVELEQIARSDESMMDATNWNKAFFLNALCRNIEGLRILCGVPIAVIGGSSTTGPTCRLVFSGVLRLFLGGNPRTSQFLSQAMEATDPDKHDLMAPEWVLHFDTHQINLLGQVMARSDDFEERLANALEVHKEYWSKTKDRRMDPNGFLAIELMGIAAFAYDRGMRFEIESEYLPMYLVSGQFLKS
jgi:hypothetical protein